MKSKHREKATLCYMLNSFIGYEKTEAIYIDIAKDVQTRFSTSNYRIDRQLPTGQNKKLFD